MWFRSHQVLSVRPLVRHSWISSIHSWSERLGCLWTILVQLLCCVLWVYWTSNTSLWTKLVQCLNSLGLEWLSHELAGMERRWVIQRLQRICLRTNRFPGYPMILSGLFSARKPNSHHSHLVFLKLLLLFYFLHPSVLMDSQHYCTYCCDHKSDPEDECVCSTVLFRDEQQDTYQDIYCKQYDFHYNV